MNFLEQEHSGSFYQLTKRVFEATGFGLVEFSHHKAAYETPGSGPGLTLWLGRLAQLFQKCSKIQEMLVMMFGVVAGKTFRLVNSKGNFFLHQS